MQESDFLQDTELFCDVPAQEIIRLFPQSAVIVVSYVSFSHSLAVFHFLLTR